MRPRNRHAFHAHLLDPATQQVGRPIIEPQAADPMIRRAADCQARQLALVQADPELVEGDLVMARKP